MGGYDYDIVVVGAGLIGSALAKYLSKENNRLKIALIGPSEEKDRSSTDIHGAYYDEGRITRALDPDPIWAVLGERSIRRYRQIEQESGITFYTDCGFLSVGTKDGEYIRNVKANAEALSCDVSSFSSPMLAKEYPYMVFGGNNEAVFSAKDSGYINPRPLVKAQIKLAKKHGCHIFDTIVESISEVESNGHLVKMANGRNVTSRRVILATGAFTFCRSLMPAGMIPDLYLHPNTVILVEVDEDDQARMHGMPSLIYKGGRHDKKTLNYVSYILPPIQYPDGKHYLKVGHGALSPPKHQIKTPTELHSWYCHGKIPETEERLVSIVKDIFPGLKMQNYHFDYCVTSRTPSNHPYVSMVTPSFGVAIGGCGYAAKSSDEIGLMAARMIAKGVWDHDLPEETFKLISKTISRL